MSNLNVSSPAGFDSSALWVSSIASSAGATFTDYQSTSFSGLPLLSVRVDKYSTFTFTQDGLTYQYHGQFELKSQSGLLSGSVSANGIYNSIDVLSGTNHIASYVGSNLSVDFGSAQAGTLPSTVGSILEISNTLLFGSNGTTGTHSYANLNTDATPGLPAKAFADGLKASGGSGSDHITGYAGNDTISAGAGNDTVSLGAGSNTANGGIGDDTVVLGFKLTDAFVSYDTAGHTVLDGPNGAHNVLSGFEHFQFADGVVNGNTGSPLVDDLFYYVSNKDVWNAHLDAETHYNQYGWHEGRNPNAVFSTTGYLAANPDVAKSGVNPLTEYATTGWKEGRDPSAGFDSELYLAHNPDVKAAGVDPLSHYLSFGQSEGRQAYAAIGKAADLGVHPGFDAEYYLLSNPDVAKAALTMGSDSFNYAYQHYETYGWQEGRNPNSVFDTKGYLDAYADVKAAGIDPLGHYDTYGWHEGRDPSPNFDTKAYEASYPDVQAAGLDPMQHYLQYGAAEGRSTFADGHFG